MIRVHEPRASYLLATVEAELAKNVGRITGAVIQTALIGNLERLREEGIDASGPFAADTMFHPRARAGFDVWIAEMRGHGLSPRNQDYRRNRVAEGVRRVGGHDQRGPAGPGHVRGRRGGADARCDRLGGLGR